MWRLAIIGSAGRGGKLDSLCQYSEARSGSCGGWAVRSAGVAGIVLRNGYHIPNTVGKTSTRDSYNMQTPWKHLLYMIYIVSVLIFGRSVFRVVEFIQGADGYSMVHEWTLYVFDAVPMFFVAVIFCFWHPGNLQ